MIETYFSSARQILATPGAKPESSLYPGFHALLEQTALFLGEPTVSFVSQADAESIGIPDWRVSKAGELLGWIELKSPHKRLDALSGHDLEQKGRFVDGLSNLILTNGWQWQHYQDGRLVTSVTAGSPESFEATALPTALDESDTQRFQDLFAGFLASTLVDYTSVGAAVSALAVRARAIRNGLTEIGEAGAGPNLLELRDSFRSLVFRNGQTFDWPRFVDSYVQIAVFGALLWRLESKKPISLLLQVGLKQGVHPLLYQCLKILWSADSRPEILEPVLEGLVQTINLIPPSLFEPPAAEREYQRVPDPIVHAYEPFFAVYDSKGREAAGVYYTPIEVVQQIVSGVESILIGTLGRNDGLLDPGAKFVDPATGTGTFLLGLAEAVGDIARSQGLPPDAVIHDLVTKRVAAFEILPGPYTIAHQRMETLLESYGAPADEKLPIYLTDTLAAPETGMLFDSDFGVAASELLKERSRADDVKTSDEVLIVLGNPPYERLPKAAALEPFAVKLWETLVAATPLDHRQDLKSARDLFVAFWLWSMWLLQPPAIRTSGAQSPTIDAKTADGIIAFVTNRTWIQGRSLRGLRSIAAAGAREMWILDLGGDTRGADGANDFGGGDANVFDIQTGVAIVWLVFDREYQGQPVVRYRRLFGNRAAKYRALRRTFDPADFDVVDGRPEDRLTPVMWDSVQLSEAPLLSQLWADEAETGFQTARDKSAYSPIGVDAADVYAETVSSPGKAALRTGRLAEWAALNKDVRAAGWSTAQSRRANRHAPDPSQLRVSRLREVQYRPLDRRWLYDDPSWVDWYREDLHGIYRDGPVATLVTNPRGHGAGPAAVHTSVMPEQHSFNNRGGKGVWALWHPADTAAAFEDPDPRSIVGDRRVGFSRSVLDWLDQIGRQYRFDDAYAYILAILTASDYTARNWRALDSEEPRVPLTLDVELFDLGASIGQRARRAWDLEAPFSGTSWGGNTSAEPFGRAIWRDDQLTFANGRVLARVPEEAWNWKVSGFRVLENWARARAGWRMTTAHAKSAQAVVDSIVELIAVSEAANAILRRFPPTTT
ncbi:type ISP restriction/modification enzyme [Pseudolysinimonas kribbensis]|uniref:type ISP restriction/modification enzyme n=1 Tax=Pseudolysinimonas kribbensis TaxID=433641 RepID=UPI0031D5D6AE